jgi:hypothetical protein
VTRLGARHGWGGLLAAFFLVLGGCDGSGSKRDAQYQRLVGTWEARTLRQGRIVSRDLRVRLTFRERLAGRSYRLRHVPASGDTTTTEGPVELLGPNTLSMSGGFSRPLVWTFTFDEPDELNDTVRLSLESRAQGSTQAFLAAIGRTGTRQRIELDLEFQSAGDDIETNHQTSHTP